MVSCPECHNTCEKKSEYVWRCPVCGVEYVVIEKCGFVELVKTGKEVPPPPILPIEPNGCYA